MSGFGDLKALECTLIDACKLYDPNLPGAHIAIAFDYYPIFLTIGMYAISLYKYELYFAMVSVLLTINWLISYIIQRAIVGESYRFIDCGSPYQMPSFGSQHIIVFETLMILYMLTWGSKFYFKLIILLRLFTSGVLVSRIFLGINTVEQLLMGAVIGFFEGIIYHLLIYYVLFPYFSHILEWTLIQWLGLEDNLCRDDSIDTPKNYDHEMHNAVRIIADRLSKKAKGRKNRYMKIRVNGSQSIHVKME